jgi:tight adherence protein B
VPLSTALKNVAKRTASKDIELLEVAVSVQTNVGGNMIEILQNISRSLREKHDLEADIQAKTASGKLTGILLAVLPVFLLIALSFLNPEYVSLFLNERNGRLMLAFAAGWELLGFLVIRKILNVKY